MEMLSQIMALINCCFPCTDIGTPAIRCQAKQACGMVVQFADQKIRKSPFSTLRNKNVYFLGPIHNQNMEKFSI